MKRNKQGKIVLIKGFFAKYLWGTNSWRVLNRSKAAPLAFKGDQSKWSEYKKHKLLGPKYPKNICSLFWGSVFFPFMLFVSSFCFVSMWIITLMLLAFAVCIWLAIVLILGFFGFFWTFCKNYYLDTKVETKFFHPYKRYGKNDEKRIRVAPWEIALPVFLVWLIWRIIKSSLLDPQAIATKAYSVISSPTLWFFVAIAVIFWGVIWFFRSTTWKVTREFLKAKKQKMCPLITFEEKQKK